MQGCVKYEPLDIQTGGWGQRENVSDAETQFHRFLKLLLKCTRKEIQWCSWGGGEFPGWEVSSMWLKAERLPQFALLWEQFHQQKLNKTSQKINSARVMKERYAASAGTEHSTLNLHYLHRACLWYLGPLQKFSRVDRPAELVWR